MDKQLNFPPTPLADIDINDLYSGIHIEMTQNIMKLQKIKAIFQVDKTSSAPIGGWDPKSYSLIIKAISSTEQAVKITAIDSTCIPIAATEDGTIFAFRATIVFANGGAPYAYSRLGPMLVYLDQSTITTVLKHLDPPSTLSRLPLGDRALAQHFLRVRLEQAIGIKIVSSMRQGILLIDGSLRVSYFDSSECGLDKILEGSKEADLAVFGVCKSSNISVLNGVMGWLVRSGKPPIYADVHELVVPLIRGLRGRVLVARLTDDGPPLRIDLWSSSSYTQEQALSAFMSSDSFAKGYPESLRLAHHLSVFTNVEVACIRSYLKRNMEVEELPTEDRRSIFLGRLRPLRLARGK